MGGTTKSRFRRLGYRVGCWFGVSPIGSQSTCTFNILMHTYALSSWWDLFTLPPMMMSYPLWSLQLMGPTSASWWAFSAQGDPSLSSLSPEHLVLILLQAPAAFSYLKCLPPSILPMSHPPYIQILHIFQGSPLSTLQLPGMLPSSELW